MHFTSICIDLSRTEGGHYRAIASKCGRWYNRRKSIRQGGEEEEDGRDHPTRTFCDVGRSSSRTDETTSVAGHHRHRFVCGDLRSRHVGGCGGVWQVETSLVGDVSGVTQWYTLA